MRPTMRFGAGLGLLLVIGVLSAAAQDALTPFAPPAQYATIPSKPFESLLAANVKWVQAKITDRKRKRRFELNNLRLPASNKPQIQALIDKLDAELKDANATLMVLKARQPDAAAQRAKKAIKQFDAATAQADAADAKQSADNFEKEAKLLADDLGAAGL